RFGLRVRRHATVRNRCRHGRALVFPDRTRSRRRRASFRRSDHGMAPLHHRRARSVTMSRWIVVGIAVLLVSGIAAGVGWLTFSNAGARWLIARAVTASHGVIEYGVVDGTLAEGITVAHVTINAATSQVQVESLVVVPSWALSFARNTI